jgi:membrane peptidoglycan carboxypeptidase
MPKLLLALIVLLGAAFLGIAVLVGTGYGVYQNYADDLVDPDIAIAQQPSGGARILDRNGRPLYEFLDDKSGLRQPVPIEEISPWLVYATVAREDASFFDNPGVNYKGLAAAAWDNFSPFGGELFEGRGGSSITQQLVKNVYFTQEERGERSIERKLKETVYALELTKRYPGREGKSQIMEWYLNQISYGSVYVGVEKAAQGYFGKSAKNLTLSEAALLAAIPASPSEYDPINNPEEALQQRNLTLLSMYEEEFINAGMLWEATAQPLGASPHPFTIDAPHFVFNVVRPQLIGLFGEEALKEDGLVVYTSLDMEAQDLARSVLEENISVNEGASGGHNGAAVGIDPKTGEILIYVGSRDFFNEDILGQNDMALALNSPGSSIKPFTYITAFMNLNWGPGTLILDEAIPSKYWDGENPPRNPISHSGPISARQALGNSLNIPAVKTILYAGVPEVIQQAKRMGITSLDGRDLGPSLTVGGVDVSLLDMVYGYTAFPNLGVLKGVQTTEDRPPGNRTLDPIAILRVEDRKGKVLYPQIDDQPVERPVPLEERVAPAQEAFLINDILTDSSAHCLTYGCGGLTIPGRPIGMKTGTSEPYTQVGLVGETWTYGYTPQLVFGTWYGNADNTPMNPGTNSYQGSAATVKQFMTAYHEGLPVETFTRPEGLVRAVACMPSGLRATTSCPARTSEDWFAKPLGGDDTWWTVTRVDSRTGRPATSRTPERYIVERRVLSVPSSASEFARDDARAWETFLGRRAQEEEPPEDRFEAAITSPDAGDPVQGLVNIRGTANTENFRSYELQYQAASNPGAWNGFASGDEAVVNGLLATWDTTVLIPGLYTIRLSVYDEDADPMITEVSVLVLLDEGDGDEPTPAATVVLP